MNMKEIYLLINLYLYIKGNILFIFPHSKSTLFKDLKNNFLDNIDNESII